MVLIALKPMEICKKKLPFSLVKERIATIKLTFPNKSESTL